jgi:hypothetical protein
MERSHKLWCIMGRQKNAPIIIETIARTRKGAWELFGYLPDDKPYKDFKAIKLLALEIG